MILPVIIGVVAIVAISSKKKKNNESGNNNIPVDVVNTPTNPVATNLNTQNQQQNKPKPKPNSAIPTPVRNAIISSAISAAAGALRGVDEHEYTGFYADKLL